MKLFVLHGPNMNLIGIRSSKCGDRMTLNKINTHIRKFIRDLNIEIKIMQTHNEVKAVSYLHRNRNKFDGIILTPGVWENSGYLLKETLEIISINYVLISLEEGDKNRDLFKSKKYFSNKNILKSFEEAILNYVS